MRSTGRGRGTSADEPGADVTALIDRHAAAVSDVESVGIETARTTREVYERLADLFDRYRGPATGTGEFGEYVAFQEALAEVLDDVDPDRVHRPDDVERAIGRFERRILREKEFDRAERDLSAVRAVAETLAETERLEGRLRKERGRLRSRRSRLRSQRSALEDRVATLEAVDDVDPEPLLEAVEGYNARVAADFEDFLTHAPAAAVARIGRKADRFPLADVPPLRGESLRVLTETGLGAETVGTLLEVAGYSDSKLSHYVDRPRALREGLDRAWFESIDGRDFALSLDESGDVVRHRVPALVSVIDPFAGPETVAHLRRVRDLAARGDYEPMRRAHRIREGADGSDLAAVRDELAAVEEELAAVERDLERIDDATDGFIG